MYKLKGKVWLYPGAAAWHFVTLPKKESIEIKKSQSTRRGWGAVSVTVTLGKTTWKTSIFPDSHSGCYMLPLKKEVRRREGIQSGEQIVYTLSKT